MAFVCLGLASCATHVGHVGKSVPPVRTDYTVWRDITYTPSDWPEALQGDLYRPVAGEPAPAVLLLHYGGWTGEDHRNHMAPIARKLAGRGYVVFNITYRKAPRWIYPAQVEDIHQALLWMRVHAKENGIDATRIATYGYSAGAHLASLAGLLKHPYDEGIKAVVAGGDPADLTMVESGSMVADFLGGKKERIPRRYIEASPVYQVTKDSPPVFLYHGTMDGLVPPEHIRRFASALERKGISHEIYWLKGRGHITAFLFPGGAHDAAIDFLDRVLRKGD
ncbi:alpha/beta hydrolase [Luteolibacter ambystomatis]|uniref:Alpha/beta hydrolase n=2 Tax=Luteolibacter ambystomatis TaxID=2824561 RepID=A0A975PGD0_9BACT|nr:alpha/beta hydrolase [Luteolibacter ambystomatis]QUE52628.1 alpha/beta hydrolase [Luteolibacter ambystomatis]